jgi:two-component system CheB/CheR fusion protein
LEERAAVGSRPDRADELRNLERLFRSTVENIPINLILYDRELRILYVNPSLAAMANAFERSASAIIGRYGGDVWPEFVWTPLKIHCERSLRTGERQYYELDYRMPGGERVIRQWTVVPIGSVSGDIQQLLVMTHDLTAQRRLLNELQETDRRKSDFIAVLSHELRNPLAAIQSSLYVMERSPEGAERAIRARSVIGRQVNHLARLVDDLLDVTRIARDRVVLRREIVDLRQIVRQTLEDHSGHLQQGRVHLEMQLPGEPVLVNADPARVAQVVANLVSNATKFTPAGRKATVSVSHSDPEGIAVLRVVDSGIGIEPAFLPRLFVPFTQADLTLNRERGGLGLGLAVVKGLVELHGGAVQVHSEGQGKGTEVIVRLPLERAQSAQPHLSPTPTAGRRRVLVIEDDPDVLDSLRAALEIDDFEVQVAQAGAEGLEMARRFRPDVVLCDIGLPEMNGYEVARAFRSDPELRSTFLVALSGYAQAPDVAHAQEAGFDEHLPKPTTLRSVQGAIARAKPRRDQS